MLRIEKVKKENPERRSQLNNCRCEKRHLLNIQSASEATLKEYVYITNNAPRSVTWNDIDSTFKASKNEKYSNMSLSQGLNGKPFLLNLVPTSVFVTSNG